MLFMHVLSSTLLIEFLRILSVGVVKLKL